MKRNIVYLFMILTTQYVYAEYKPYNFNLIEGSIIKGNGYPNGWGTSTKDTLFEIQGSHRYKLLDLYWFVDRSNIFNDSELSDKKKSDSNYTYGEINPRISLDGILKKDLSLYPITEWFISTQYDFDNVKGKKWGKNQGLKKYYIGVGNYIKVPKFDYFKTNLYARYVDRNYGRSEKSWDGYMFNSSYGATLHKFKNGMKLGFNGWLDYDFGDKKRYSYEKSNSFQWQNQVRLYLTDSLSTSYTYQINHNFSSVDQNSSNKDTQSFGVHYAIMF